MSKPSKMKNLLTKRQEKWLMNRKIIVGETYMFPRWGFHFYDKPHGYSQWMNLNPFTQSLDHERFLVKEKYRDYVRGNFYASPEKGDFWMLEYDLAQRDAIEQVLLIVFTVIPLILWNQLRRLRIAIMR